MTNTVCVLFFVHYIFIFSETAAEYCLLKLCFVFQTHTNTQKSHLQYTAGEAGKGEWEKKGRKTQASVFQERKAGNITQIEIVVNLDASYN